MSCPTFDSFNDAVYPELMSVQDRQTRLSELGARAEAALATGDVWEANELLRQHRLIEDGGRDPEDLLSEGMRLIRMASNLAEPDPSGSRDDV